MVNNVRGYSRGKDTERGGLGYQKGGGTGPYGERATLMRNASADAVKVIEDRSADVVFLDAWQTYDNCHALIAQFLPKAPESVHINLFCQFVRGTASLQCWQCLLKTFWQYQC